MPGLSTAKSILTCAPARNSVRKTPSLLPGRYSSQTMLSRILLYAPVARCVLKRPNRLAMKLQWPNAQLEWRCAKKKEHVTSMSDSLVTRFGAPDTPFCNLATARVTIIPAPQEILDAPSQGEHSLFIPSPVVNM